MRRVDSLQGFIVHNEGGTAQKYKLIIPGWSPASWDPEIALRFEHGCFRFIVVREACDSALVENAPHLDRPTSWEPDAASLAAPDVHWWKGHSGSLSCFSSDNLIKEDKQKTIASSTTRKPNGIVCVGSQTRDIGVAGGHPSRVGAKNKENCFIMLMKKRRMKISIFLK